MTLLKWVWTEGGTDETSAPPQLVYYVLRAGMFILSFVLEDWAVYELVPSPRHRRQAVVLVASSYVTWTYQTHTFSNSVETLLVAWSLVLIQRIVENKVGGFAPYTSKDIANRLPIATVFYLCLRHSFVRDRRRGIQSDHIPRFHSYSRFAAGPSFLAEVSFGPELVSFYSLLTGGIQASFVYHYLILWSTLYFPRDLCRYRFLRSVCHIFSRGLQLSRYHPPKQFPLQLRYHESRFSRPSFPSPTLSN